MSMNENSHLYQQYLAYNRHTGPYQSFSLPWWVRSGQEIYWPRHGCHIEPMICGQHVFGSIANDIANAEHTVDIISWGFDPGMVLIRGAKAGAGQRYGDLLLEATKRKVTVRLLIWHDDGLAQKFMKNLPGYYGLQFPAIGCKRNGYYSPEHQAYNAEWFDMACKGGEYLQFQVRNVPANLLPKSLAGESSPGGPDALVTKLYASHHQKMVLIDYVDPPRAIGYVMGHNSITDFWDTPEHLFQDPRRERMYDKDVSDVWNQGPSMGSDGGAFVSGYRSTEYEIAQKERAMQAYLNAHSKVMKPYQDVSCRLLGPVLCDLNHNFCQAWEESVRPKSLVGELLPWSVPSIKVTQLVVETVKEKLGSDLDFIKTRGAIPSSKFKLERGQHSVQLLRTQPLHGEKTIKECYANLTRQINHYIFIQNQYIQYEPWTKHLTECIERLRSAGLRRKIYVFILTSMPESDGMDLPTYDVVAKLGQSETMVVEHEQALVKALERKVNMPLSREQMADFGINVVMGSLWTSAKPAKKRKLLPSEYEEIYIHSKVAIVDDAAFTIGSANLNLRSMALDSELNVLGEDHDVAYKLRCDLFRQCSGDSGPAKFADMSITFRSWTNRMRKMANSRGAGEELKFQLSPFHVARKPGKPVV
jgi:phosphatidylserine/phosphatidylglycerophosphate/cardiolipin synthase-like enzyme